MSCKYPSSICQSPFLPSIPMKYPMAAPTVRRSLHSVCAHYHNLLLVQAFSLVCGMRQPLLFKQLRNPIIGMVPIVANLAPLIGSTANFARCGSLHCVSWSALVRPHLLDIVSILTNPIVCLEESPDVELSLHCSIRVGHHHELVFRWP